MHLKEGRQNPIFCTVHLSQFHRKKEAGACLSNLSRKCWALPGLLLAKGYLLCKVVKKFSTSHSVGGNMGDAVYLHKMGMA